MLLTTQPSPAQQNIAAPDTAPETKAPETKTADGYKYLQRAIAALVKKETIGTEMTIEEKTRLVQENQAAIELARQAMMLEYRAPLPQTPQQQQEQIDQFSGYRALARLLRAQGDVLLARGDSEAAANAYLDAVQLGQLVARGPIINLLVGVAVTAIGRGGLAENVQNLNAKAAAQAAQRLAKLQSGNEFFAETLRDESQVGVEHTQQMIVDETKWRAARDYYRELMAGEIADAMQAYILSQQKPGGDLIEDFAAPLANANRADAALEPRQMVDALFPTVRHVITQGRFLFTRMQTENALLCLSLALRAHHITQGEYPATLAELQPALPPKILLDPFGYQEPLRYEKRGANYRLWSIGPDGLDDEGRAIEDNSAAVDDAKTKTQFSYPRFGVKANSRGDIVAGVNTR